MLVLFCVKLYDLDDNVCRQIHSLDSDVFVRAVIGVSAGSQIRTWETFET